MRYQSLDKLASSYWYSFSDEPIATRGRLALRISDPSYLYPEEAPDGLWHMFAHTLFGIEHFTSTSGFEWKREHRVFPYGHSPFIYKEGSTYYMVYESHSQGLKKRGKAKRLSRILISSSTDLALWSEPRVILTSAAISRSPYESFKRVFSRPQLVKLQGEYRLYFGFGENRLYDSKESATVKELYAGSFDLDGPYIVSPKEIFTVDRDSSYSNLAVGGVRIVPCSDGLAAFKCSYYYDKARDSSSTALLFSLSSDGLNWSEDVLIQTTATRGWASQYITSVDVRYRESEDTWYCYYSATSKRRLGPIAYVAEAIGLLLAKDK